MEGVFPMGISDTVLLPAPSGTGWEEADIWGWQRNSSPRKTAHLRDEPHGAHSRRSLIWRIADVMYTHSVSTWAPPGPLKKRYHPCRLCAENVGLATVGLGRGPQCTAPSAQYYPHEWAASVKINRTVWQCSDLKLFQIGSCVVTTLSLESLWFQYGKSFKWII